MSYLQSSSLPAKEGLNSGSVRLGNDTDFEMAYFCSWVWYDRVNMFLHVGGKAFRGESFAGSLLGERSDWCHEGACSNQISEKFGGSVGGVEIGVDGPV